MSSRPRLHHTPERGWINDAYGLTWHDGRYHLFFQHVPDRAEWAPKQHWGHAISDDLVHWTEQPIALSPGDGDDGVWSGSVAGGRAFYTSVRLDRMSVGTVRVADPLDDGWREWRKGAPCVEAPEHLGLEQLRDPFVLSDGDGWRMVLGAGDSSGTAMVLSWVSPDLSSWTYDGVLAARPAAEDSGTWTGTVWECPQLLPVGDRWVLVVSVWSEDVTHFEAAAVGSLEGGRFVAERWQRLTFGAPYAGSGFTDADGRPCLMHWLRGVEDPAAGWSGAHSVPQVVSIEGDRVVLNPHPVVAAHAETLEPGTTRTVGDATIEHRGDELAVNLPDDTLTMPCADDLVQVLVDGPVVEVFGSQGVAAFSVNRAD